jgi:hypothetical protein
MGVAECAEGAVAGVGEMPLHLNCESDVLCEQRHSIFGLYIEQNGLW